MERARSALLYLIVLVGVFLLSLAMFLLQEKSLERRTILFPDVRTGQIIPEYRFIAKDSNQSTMLQSLMKAIVAGPQDITLGKVFPQDTEVRSVHAWKGNILISVNGRAQVDAERVLLPPKERFELLERTLRHNWPLTGKITFLVDGVEVFIE